MVALDLGSLGKESYIRHKISGLQILDFGLRSLDFPLTLRIPPGFCNGLDWKALVEDSSPQLAKLRN